MRDWLPTPLFNCTDPYMKNLKERTIMSASTQHSQASHDVVMAAYTTPQPADHLQVHNIVVSMNPEPSPKNSLPLVPVVLPDGETYVVLAHLAWRLDFLNPREAELEACAKAWAATLPAHRQALAELWVQGFPMAPVPCLRWPLLRAFLTEWKAKNPESDTNRLLMALAQDGNQVEPEKVESAQGRPPKINDDTVRQLHQLLEEGRTRMEAAAALDISVPAIKKIVAGTYPFSTIAAQDAWNETFGADQKAGITG